MRGWAYRDAFERGIGAAGPWPAMEVSSIRALRGSRSFLLLRSPTRSRGARSSVCRGSVHRLPVVGAGVACGNV
ncbi:MAG: hypothetical protein ACR2GG_11620, partial [Gemmatimonadaceae bacterium]